MTIALTRLIAPGIVDCELMHLEREPIDFARATRQHERYEAALASLGCSVRRLPPLPDQPDSVFVEDTVVVLPGVAIITRPGAESRRAEVQSVAEAIRSYRPIAFIESPGTIDGGDVLTIGSTLYVGESARTNAEGIRQLTRIASQRGHSVTPVSVSGCLHLKSAVTLVSDDVVLMNPAWVNPSFFGGLRQIEVDPGEPFAANALLIGETVIYPAAFDATRERLEQNGIDVHVVEVDELAKAEGGVTCCSIVIPENA